MDFMSNKKMIEMRLDGYSIRMVAEEVGCSHQMVANYIKSIYPDGDLVDPSTVSIPILTGEERLAIADCIVRCDGDLAAISLESGRDEAEVRRLMDYIAVRKPAICRKCIYPAIGTWMRRNMVTVKSLASEIGISQPTLSSIFSGERHMTMKILSELKARTNMSYRELLEGHMGPIDEEIDRELSVLKANEKDTRLNFDGASAPPVTGWVQDTPNVGKINRRTDFTQPPAKRRA